MNMSKRNILKAFACSFALMALSFYSLQASAIEISNRYRSPRNLERSVRKATTLIILHTTEAPERSSLNKLSERGEAHYCVTPSGRIFAIVDRDREAYHAGRSMWNAKDDVDKFSIGIECVGYHNEPMGIVQLKAIASLVDMLKKMYGLSDDAVICHSHVAYGAPNKWQKRRHRGRKRCGMLFVTTSVRNILDLSSKPRVDPDTRAGRLVVGDPYLRNVLYGKMDIMASHYPSKKQPAKSTSAKAPSAKKSPVKKPKEANVAETKNTNVKSTYKISAHKSSPKTVNDLKAQGYKCRGTVAKGKTAMMIVGSKWKSSSTYYVIRGKVTSGSSINPLRIEEGTVIWTK